MPKISIIVPVYNVAKYLNRCITSILEQTFRDFEVILVNDGSIDNSKTICEEFAQKDSRIRVINKINGGLSDARNAGLKVSLGEFIAFVDGDDFIDPRMYEYLYRLIKENDAAISTCKIKSYYEEDIIEQSYINIESLYIFDSRTAIKCLYSGELTGFSACNKLFSKKLFEKLEFPQGRVYEDAAIMYQLYDKANKIVSIDHAFYYYLRRENSITSSKFSEKRLDIVQNFIETYSFMEEKYPEICDLLVALYFSSLRNMIVDIINEKSVIKNIKYIYIVRNHIKNQSRLILKSNIIPLSKKVLSQTLLWLPISSIFIYKVRVSFEQYYHKKY
ncbi:glycosyltransferase family 2 protein [Litchfieldia alkalitelluris]|uniref:glycosyltransferase family 2 protein n=1 Tax=Litchfieldia alkalitelluris TaxID=304268 RepID=UPI000998B0F1|nr:glycosyltransferase [Litchfieldia alkalitelluris]